MDTQLISLTLYEAKHEKNLLEFYLTEEQKRYTAMPLEALQACIVDKQRKPIVILAGEHPVGFFVLHSGKGIREFTDHNEAILLRSFCINHLYQGEKIAAKALELLPSFIIACYPNKKEVVLAVDKENRPAKGLYTKVGFQDTGVEKLGRSGPMSILSYRLDV